MDEKKSIVSIFFQHITAAFALSVIALSVTGWLLGDSQIEYDGLFRLGSAGLSFESLAQMFAFSVVISILETVLTSDIFFKKAMLLWRMILLLFFGIVSCVVFAVVFRWFPLDIWEAWAAFLTFFVVGFGLGCFVLIAKTKLEDRRYSKLLSDYKRRNSDD
ncbi:MAG: hypothetical protein FWB91_07220 [Defluviitaleaceae bacterium]|nr:hypothetical protein [Defluviitaleaceae bacterium]